MKLIITYIDNGPDELYGQIPLAVETLRMMPGPDRPDYWLAQVTPPIQWIDGGVEKHIPYITLAAGFVGEQISPAAKGLLVAIAYVTDLSLLEDATLTFAKCRYTAVGQVSAAPKAQGARA